MSEEIRISIKDLFEIASSCPAAKDFMTKKYPEIFKGLYSMGQRLIHENKTEYLIARVDTNCISLIDVQTGNCYTKPCSVLDVHRITKDEFATMIYGYHSGDWKLKL